MLEIARRIESNEPLVDYDIYSDVGFEATAERLRRIVEEVPRTGTELSFFEIPRLASWRDREALECFSIDATTLVNILNQGT
jgi:hypothetical protein